MQHIVMGVNKLKIIPLALLCMYGCSFPEAPAKVWPCLSRVQEERITSTSNAFCTHSTAASNSSADYPPRPSGLWLSHGQARKTAPQNVN